MEQTTLRYSQNTSSARPEARTEVKLCAKAKLRTVSLLHNYACVERATAWDRIVDQRLREKQLEEIERMAKRQAQEAQVLSQILMSPVVALAARLKDSHGARTLENADMHKLLEMSFETAKAVPRLHKAERLARGVKVVDTGPVNNPGSTQGGVEWRLTVYQPERTEALPDLNVVDAAQPEEWEEA